MADISNTGEKLRNGSSIIITQETALLLSALTFVCSTES